MAPFVNEESTPVDETFDISKLDIDMISPKRYSLSSDDNGAIFEDDDNVLDRTKTKKLIYIGCAASFICIVCILIYFFTNNNQTVDVEELPVIKADYRPIKERISSTESAPHKDKKIYTYITNENDNTVKSSSQIRKNEHVISVNELDRSRLTEEDKKMILKAFEDLAPNAQRRSIQKSSRVIINNNASKVSSNDNAKVVIEKKPAKQKELATNVLAEKPKKKNVEQKAVKKRSNELANLINLYSKSKKKNLKEFLKDKRNTVNWNGTNNIVPVKTGTIFVQLASLPSMGLAEREFSRLARLHRILHSMGHKIVKVRVGNEYRYRIMVGPFHSKKEASLIVKKMQNDGLKPLW